MKLYSEKISDEIRDLYAYVFRCPNVKCNEHHALNKPNSENCYIPRDFFGYYNTPKKILIIGTNPGKILKKETIEYKKIHQARGRITPLEAREMVKKHLELSAEMFKKGMHIQENKLRIAFHKDFPEAVSKVLRVEKKDIFDYIYYTNLLKCQTKPPFTRLKLRDKKYLVKKCYETHLRKEIEILKPELILTYGDEVYEFLPLRDLIPIKVFKLPKIWAEASMEQRKQWRDMLDVVSNNIFPIVNKIKENMKK